MKYSPYVWTTKDGRVLPLPCISDSHLANIVKLIIKMAIHNYEAASYKMSKPHKVTCSKCKNHSFLKTATFHSEYLRLLNWRDFLSSRAQYFIYHTLKKGVLTPKEVEETAQHWLTVYAKYMIAREVKHAI